LYLQLWQSHPLARAVAAVALLAAALLATSAGAGARGGGAPWAARNATVVESGDDLELDLHRELNALRRRAGLRPLRWSRQLSRAAVHHSTMMGTKGFFSHTSANGATFRMRVERFYRRPPGWDFYVVGENLLRGGPDVAAPTVLQRWLDSPGHRRIVLSSRWRDVGFGVVRVQNAPGVYDGDTVAIVTADFGHRG
jgi:uncharacterized protein YkwD